MILQDDREASRFLRYLADTRSAFLRAFRDLDALLDRDAAARANEPNREEAGTEVPGVAAVGALDRDAAVRANEPDREEAGTEGPGVKAVAPSTATPRFARTNRIANGLGWSAPEWRPSRPRPRRRDSRERTGSGGGRDGGPRGQGRRPLDRDAAVRANEPDREGAGTESPEIETSADAPASGPVPANEAMPGVARVKSSTCATVAGAAGPGRPDVRGTGASRTPPRPPGSAGLSRDRASDPASLGAEPRPTGRSTNKPIPARARSGRGSCPRIGRCATETMGRSRGYRSGDRKLGRPGRPARRAAGRRIVSPSDRGRPLRARRAAGRRFGVPPRSIVPEFDAGRGTGLASRGPPPVLCITRQVVDP